VQEIQESGPLLLASFEIITPRRSQTMTATTRNFDPTALRNTLCLSFELGEGTWKLTFSPGFGESVVRRTVTSRDREAVLHTITAMKDHFGLPSEARVVSCYEAGREGFWLHRFLEAHGVENLVVDSSSIEVSRRRRRAKTDRLDGESLLDLLFRHLAGSRKKVWSVVRVPTVEQEDRRHLHRELQSARRDRTRVTNRMKGLLANHGLTLNLKKGVAEQLAALRQWDGSPLPTALRARLAREWERVEFYTGLIEHLEGERRMLLRTGKDPAIEKIRQLNALRGIGTNSAWLYVMELFAWRDTPTPDESGKKEREQGMSKAGNRHVRSMAIEIAWGWLRFQPESELSKWYQRRFGGGSKRVRKIGIVALARKLLIELWRFLETGVLPEGAQLKTDVRIR
jgi:transposase